ncbi:acyl carrier protein, partial [Kitasatospora herbaricolor]|uniref:acyl carrier protein n=1 Tax=Kitasatospora herbaricolor TaxID=68217 RepID=UPI0036D8F2B9
MGMVTVLAPVRAVVGSRVSDTHRGEGKVSHLVRAESATRHALSKQAVVAVWSRELGLPGAWLDSTADFHRLGGDSVSPLAMLAGVCRGLPGAAAGAGPGGGLHEPARRDRQPAHTGPGGRTGPPLR